MTAMPPIPAPGTPNELERLKELGRWIRDSRKAKSLNQEQLAGKLFISKGPLARLELGQRRVDLRRPPDRRLMEGLRRELEMQSPRDVITGVLGGMDTHPYKPEELAQVVLDKLAGELYIVLRVEDVTEPVNLAIIQAFQKRVKV